MATSAPVAHIKRRRILLVVVIALAIYVVIPQFGGFRDSWQYLQQPHFGDVLTAIGFTLLTYACAALTYCLLAFKRLRYGRTLLVQFAAMFINRLLPAGIGAAGVGYTYLRSQKHSPPQATATVAVNNILGFSGHILLVLTILITSHVAIPVSQTVFWWLLPALGAIAVLAIAGFYKFGSKRIRRFTLQLGHDFGSYKRRFRRLLLAQLSSLGVTLTNVLSLYYCALALDVNLSLAAIILIFTFGVGLGTATPTPGGLGGFEAGLVAGFVAYGIDADKALAAALLYRLVSYWLALVLGGLAFLVVERKKLLRL